MNKAEILAQSCIDIKEVKKETLKSWLEKGLIFSGKKEKLKTPLLLNIEVTSQCNSKCVMCFNQSGIPSPTQDELNLIEIKDILNQCESLGIYYVSISGGEPFIRKDILEILKYARKRGLIISLVTNGTLLTQKKVKQLREILDFRFDKIQLSLDGSKPEIHDRQRGRKGLFKKTLKGMENLAKLNIPYVINTVASRINFMDIPNILRLAESKGAVAFRMMRLHPFGNAFKKNAYQKYKMNFAQQCALFEFIDRKRLEHKENSRITISDENGFIFPFNHNSFRSKIKLSQPSPPPTYVCAAGTSSLSIGPNGNVAPCVYLLGFPEFIIGNVKNETIETLWNKNDCFKQFRGVNQIEGKCRQCAYLNSCRGGCLAISYVMTKKTSGPDPECNIFEDDSIFFENKEVNIGEI